MLTKIMEEGTKSLVELGWLLIWKDVGEEENRCEELRRWDGE